MQKLQIRNIGKMWRVMQGGKTLAFASTYRHAWHRLKELGATTTNQPDQE